MKENSNNNHKEFKIDIQIKKPATNNNAVLRACKNKRA